MKADNTKSKIGFIMDHVYWAVIAWVVYKGFLFRCLGTHSLTESRLILLAIILGCSVLGIALEMRSQRNSVSVSMNLIAGFGLYSVLAYFPITRNLILIILAAAGGLVELYLIFFLVQLIRKRRVSGRMPVRRIIKAGTAARNIICAGLAAIMITIGINAVWGNSIAISSVKPARYSQVEEQTIANNIETLVLLKEDTWVNLSVEEKLGVLQTVANIEQRYLGLPNELNVGAANLKEGHAGYYSDRTHEIIVSMDSLLNDPPRELVDTVAHEAYHSLQYRMVDAYDEASEDKKTLILYYEASVYKEEFADYTDGHKDFCGYYTQKCESDARRYARSAVDEYFERIEEYLEAGETEIDSIRYAG